MRFYISREDLHKAERGCDLGDSVGVRVYLYPHTDDLWRLITCQTTEPFRETEVSSTDTKPEDA